MRERGIKKWQQILLGGLIGLLAFLLIFTPQSLDITDDSYILDGFVERDIIQHYTGWLFYRDAALSFPLGVAEDLGGGSAIAFADSIPLFSILFRPLFAALPTVQFFGWFTLLAFVLAGVASALLLSLFADGFLPLAAGVSVFVTAPILVERAFRHTALAAQFLILFALCLYFKNEKEGFRFRWGYALLLVLSVLIHFYFVPMIFAILLADLLQEKSDRKQWVQKTLFLFAHAAAVLVTAWSIGYFHRPTQSAGPLAYGYFTMNLNALFNPKSVSGIVWSNVLPTFGQGLGSAEGFNYVGLGVLLALLFAALYFMTGGRLANLFRLIRRRKALTMIAGLLFLFAVSTTVVANNTAFVRLSLPYKLLALLSIFRSSGRLFWPVYYLLMLFAVVFVVRRFTGKALLILLFAAVQIADLSPALLQKRAYFEKPDRRPVLENPLQSPFWDEAKKDGYTELFTVSDEGVHRGLYLAHYAVLNGMSTNEPFLARNDLLSYKAEGDAVFAGMMAGALDRTKLYVFGDVNRFFDAADRLGDDALAVQVDGFYVIAPAGEAADTRFAGVTPIEKMPFTIADYDDLTWTDGILNDDRRIVLFYDNAFTRDFLADANAIFRDGRSIPILEKDYRDRGFVMVTLDVEDAGFLAGAPLHTDVKP